MPFPVRAGIAAGLLLIPMIVQPLAGGGPSQPQIFALDALGWLSALGGLVLVRYRFAFLRQTTKRQRMCAAAVWGINGLAFLALVTIIVVFS